VADLGDGWLMGETCVHERLHSTEINYKYGDKYNFHLAILLLYANTKPKFYIHFK
jgi:hypothetical protein